MDFVADGLGSQRIEAAHTAHKLQDRTDSIDWLTSPFF